MTGLYANRFTVEINDIVRIVFVDERAPIEPGLPMASATATEVVMTADNARLLRDLLVKHLPFNPDGGIPNGSI